ncbi:MAG: hypothetical protein L0Y58_03900, partial [Verrucomicrobia subdivision 3 bacterium]|nr:hypothetical protein [Limisphaerales bacterium]
MRTIALMLLIFPAVSTAQNHQESVATFDTDPQWEGYRNRLVPDPPPLTRQSFGYRLSQRAGGASAGEIGGWIQRSTTPAWYAKQIAPVTLTNRLSASGKFAVTRAEGGSAMLFGWFNARSRGWRMPNSLVLRLDGNGGKYWLFFEYGTQHWFTGGGATFEGEYQTTKTKPFAADGTVHTWRLEYDPKGDAGELELVLDGTSYLAHVPPAHVRDGAVFDRFGLVNAQLTGDGMEVFFDDLEINGERFAFNRDPRWDANGNEVEFRDRVRRPFHDFGFSQTRHAGGKMGEIGGIIWRDEQPAYYAVPIAPLTLQDHLCASGTVVLRGAASDSGAWFGFFDSSTKRNKTTSDHQVAPANLLGILVEGPSHVGHYFRAGYRNRLGEGMLEDSGPAIQPDGKSHRWSLRYIPNASGEDGEI